MKDEPHRGQPVVDQGGVEGQSKRSRGGEPRRLVVIGQGYVGLPLSVEAVRVGYHVVGLDADAHRTKMLQVAESYVEDVSNEQLREMLDTGRFHPTTNYSDAVDFDICVITVPTPLRDGAPDLRYIEESGAAIAPYLRPGCTVVLESTTYPGTTEDLLRPILEQGSGLRAGQDFFLGYSPERIDPGNPTYGLPNTPKVISGMDEASLARVREFYGSVVERTVEVSSTRTAELAKLLENTYRHINIAMINELAIFASDLGVNIWEAVEAASSKPFGFMPFTPGPGVGGHCLPIDPSYLSWQVKRKLGHYSRFIELANEVNHNMPQYVVTRLMKGLNQRRRSLNGSRLLLLGLAYKRNVGDFRESPALDVAKKLTELGAQVRAVEPYATATEPLPQGVSLVDLTAEEISSADAVVVLTDHDQFDYDDIAARAAYVFDTRNRCRGADVEVL